MSKKFIVETLIDSVTLSDIEECLRRGRYITGTFAPVAELSQPPEVKKIETGILMSPAEICKCGVVAKIGFKVHADSYCELLLSDENIGKRIVISSRVFPREFYRDIVTTWDFNSIPVGSLVEISCHHGGDSFYGRFDRIDGDTLHLVKGYCAPTKTIKSIRIVELLKE